jgi:transglutaminase-like putative cysteine protease
MKPIFMKKLILLAMILCLASAASAQQDIYFSSYITTKLNVSSSLEVVTTSPNYEMSYLNAKLYFFPEGYDNQFVTVKHTEPKAIQEENTVNFRWTHVEEGTLNYQLTTTVKVKNDIKKIKKKIKFPADIPEELKPYTLSTETIDSDTKGIVSLANLLAQGEDDLYVVVHKLAAWVEDSINYSLSTVTAEVQQKSSWVLSNKQGVCDEISVLFIALCRSLGIPAKFVSGTAYTESPLFPKQWGAHGWAEVYFPGYGWVPFDITYGELGWVDPSHIKLRESLDPTEPSVKFEWRGRFATIEAQPLKIDASIEQYGSRLPEDIKLTARALKWGVDFGSYDLIEAEVQNLRDYYIATDIMLAKSAEVEVFDDQKLHILMKPNQKKSIYWRIRVSPDLNTRYVYTIPLLVYTEKNLSKKVRITSSVKEPYYTKSEIEEYYNRLSTEERKTYSTDISLECSTDKNRLYTYEILHIDCTVQNLGNTALEDISVCIKTDCYTADLGISQAEEYGFNLNFDSSGKKDVSATVKNTDIFQAYPMEIEVLDVPKITIADLEYDNNISYDDAGQITFTLARESYSIPKDITITMRQDKKIREWDLPSLEEDKEFVINIKGEEFSKERMDIKILVDYKDERDKEYSTEEEFTISLEKATFFQKIRIYINKVVNWIADLF